MDYNFSFEINSGLAAVLGTLFGGGVSIFGIWLQTRNERKRDYIKLAKELGMEEFNRWSEYANKNASIKNKSYTIMPVESFITYYIKYFDLMHKNGASPEKLKELEKVRVKIEKHYQEVDSPIVRTTAVSAEK